ncbi:MAG: hypothetical protein A2Y55_03940 [Actinobacteria bacterium RBG_16_68_12]|nr:MAG: hypothetical protein A2Y55_03940 [Actinobacteria bacterium RBG_16_68_12]
MTTGFVCERVRWQTVTFAPYWYWAAVIDPPVTLSPAASDIETRTPAATPSAMVVRASRPSCLSPLI